MPYVYILECRDVSYYVGSTRDLERRLAGHEAGSYPDGYTASRRPVKLVASRRSSASLRDAALLSQPSR